jgi:hypothetical protein
MIDFGLRVIVMVIITGFLGILVWHVPRTDLIVLVLLTLALVGRDLMFPDRRG